MGPSYKTNDQISTNLQLICAPSSIKQPPRDQKWLPWALGHDGEFLVLTPCKNSQPTPPCWRNLGSTWRCSAGGNTTPETERELGKSIPASSSRGRSALPLCSTRERAENHQRAGSNFTWIRMFYFSPASDEFDLTFYADKPWFETALSGEQVPLQRHSCCMTDATVLSQHCFQCLQQLHSIPLPDIKCTLILINGKKINLWGK